MKVFVTRALALGALIGLYAIHPIVGVGALAAGYGFIAGRRAPGWRPARGTSTSQA